MCKLSSALQILGAAVVITVGATLPGEAADFPDRIAIGGYPAGPDTTLGGVLTCVPQEIVVAVLFDKYGQPTVPARTPMYYCLTGHTLTPGEVPPPPEYCCR